MPRADDPVRRRCTLVLVAALAAAACADSTAPHAPERIERPALRALIAEAPDRDRRVVARLEVPPDVDPWTVEASERRVKSVEVGPGKAPVRELVLLGREGKALTIPLARASEPFNRVEVVMRIARADALDVELSLAGREVAVVTVALRASQHEQVVGIDVPYPSDLSVDRIVLRVTREGPVTFGPLELVREPWRNRLPPPEGPARLIEIASDARRAVGVSSARAMAAVIDAGVGTELAFAYGVPESFADAPPGAELVVALVAEGASAASVRYALAQGGAEHAAWRSVRLPLAAYAGRRVEARFSIEGAGAAEVVCAISEPEAFRPSDDAPTVVLITSDTHRADHVGLFSNRGGASARAIVATPALDALAERALLFDACFSSSNVTIPSHVAIMTGTHPRDTRVVHNNQLVSDEAHTLAERFREQGFATVAAISASHLDDRASGLGQGFDRVATTREAKRRASTTLAALWPALDDARGKPLFVWLHLFDAHTPYAPPSPFDRAYYPKDKDPFAADLPAPDLDPRLFPANMPGLKDLEYPASQYRGEVSYLDSELARLFAVPRVAEGIVAFTADHGESFGAHGVWWEHAELYPETIHVPLLIAYPGVLTAERVSARVNQLDLGRTLLDLAGLAAVPFPGTSLAERDERAGSAPIFTLSAYGFSAAITSGAWHLILHLDTHPIDAARVQPFKQKHEVELYDLASDPGAERDLSRQEHERAAALRKTLIQWLAQRARTGLKTDGAQDAETLARLAQLGYVSPEFSRDTDEPWFDESCACDACRRFD